MPRPHHISLRWPDPGFSATSLNHSSMCLARPGTSRHLQSFTKSCYTDLMPRPKAIPSANDLLPHEPTPGPVALPEPDISLPLPVPATPPETPKIPLNTPEIPPTPAIVPTTPIGGEEDADGRHIGEGRKAVLEGLVPARGGRRGKVGKKAEKWGRVERGDSPREGDVATVSGRAKHGGEHSEGSDGDGVGAEEPEKVEKTAGKLAGTGHKRGVHRILTPHQRERVIAGLYRGETMAEIIEKMRVPRMRELVTRSDDPDYGAAVRLAMDEAGTELAEEKLLEIARKGNVVALRTWLFNRGTSRWKPEYALGASGRDELTRRAGNAPISIRIRSLIVHPPAQLAGKPEVIDVPRATILDGEARMLPDVASSADAVPTAAPAPAPAVPGDANATSTSDTAPADGDASTTHTPSTPPTNQANSGGKS